MPEDGLAKCNHSQKRVGVVDMRIETVSYGIASEFASAGTINASCSNSFIRRTTSFMASRLPKPTSAVTQPL